MRITQMFVIIAVLIPASAQGQNSGLLLGLHADSAYSTLYIAPVAGKIQIAARAPGIIVPRADGFWRLNAVRMCFVAAESDEARMFVYRRDLLTRKRIGQRGVDVYQAGSFSHEDEAERNIGGCQGYRQSFRERMKRDPAEDDDCNQDDLELTYVSPNHISFRSSMSLTEFCAPANYYYEESRSVMDYDAHRLDISPFIPPRDTAAQLKRWRLAKQECLPTEEYENWNIVRGRGRWDALMLTTDGRMCRGHEPEEIRYTGDLIGGIVRNEQVAKWRVAITQKHSSFDDVFISPSGDLVIVRVRETLYAYAARGSQLGNAVATIRLKKDAQVVMAEWATGHHVERWKRALEGI